MPRIWSEPLLRSFTEAPTPLVLWDMRQNSLSGFTAHELRWLARQLATVGRSARATGRSASSLAHLRHDAGIKEHPAARLDLARIPSPPRRSRVMPDTAAAINEHTSQIVKALDRLVDALLVMNGELEEVRKLLANGNSRKARE